MNKEKNKEEPLIITPMKIKDYPLKEDVVGDARGFIDDFIQATRSEDIYKHMGIVNDKSFLITGPPGNGKTLSIEALVNEANNESYNAFLESDDQVFKDVKLLGLRYDISKYGSKYINQGSKTAQVFFNTCFKMAEAGMNTLIVFDEAEELFSKRSESSNHKEDKKLLNTIMKNMQELHYRDNMYMVMMSNFPEAFDEASIRAGRVDRKYEFGNPTLEERAFAFSNSINKINSKAGYEVIRKTNPQRLASDSNGFSYSDITEAVNSSVKRKADEIVRKESFLVEKDIYIGQQEVESSVLTHKRTFVKPNKKGIGFV